MGFIQSMITSNRNNRSMQKGTAKYTRDNGKTTFPSGNTVTQADRAATKKLKKFNTAITLSVWLSVLVFSAVVTYFCASWLMG